MIPYDPRSLRARGFRPAFGAALLGVAFLVACQSRLPVGEAMIGEVPGPADYDAAVRGATRELRLYTDGLTTALLLRATYLDPDLRRAMEAERAHRMLLEPAAHEEHVQASLAEAEAAHVVVISADSHWREDLEIGFGEDAPWRVRLFAGERTCTPERIEELTPTPLDLHLYPHHTRWSTLWKVRFSTDCGRGPLVLQVTGPRGAGEVAWRTAEGE